MPALLSLTMVGIPLPVRAAVVSFECRGEKTQGSGVATGLPMNHPLRVRYRLDTDASMLTEMEISDEQLSTGQQLIPVKIYGNLLIAKFSNLNTGKDYEIQIRGDEKRFSITVYPEGIYEPDAWYGACQSLLVEE
ncbi:hypothetical protein [Synechococcus sp. A18-25c]|uniref:hypothetical protein n=1 Tax=Synechococcus sp. A18-25c TaxID=1866938 RepID=UPI001645B0D1|nr:hypothetical protein [Synechococcus sp. A18-25c]MEC7247580.1 hypothetical protein [Cyanobacteriota bacterium]MEC7896337.1 hypothetical protein [Cyanobacteriota bacterium]